MAKIKQLQAGLKWITFVSIGPFRCASARQANGDRVPPSVSARAFQENALKASENIRNPFRRQAKNNAENKTQIWVITGYERELLSDRSHRVTLSTGAPIEFARIESFRIDCRNGSFDLRDSPAAELQNFRAIGKGGQSARRKLFKF